MEWHLATLNFICQSASHCPKLKASEVFLQGQTVLNWIYLPIQDTVVGEQANRRPDVIRQVVYKNKEQDRSLNRPLWVHGITLGLDLRLDHLKLLVECAQRATSWSTCGWTLLSHNSLIYVIASCVAPYQRPLRNPLWSNLSVCVHDSQPHPGCWWCRAQTGPTGFRWTSDFGNHADSQQVCYLRLGVCWCYWLLYALGLCSRCMWATPVYS